MSWYSKTTFGIIIHWGIYSVPGYSPIGPKRLEGNGSEWYMKRLLNPYHLDNNEETKKFHETYFNNYSYEQFSHLFKAENYDPKEWVQFFKKIKAEYVILTSKHHDGFCLFDGGYYEENGQKYYWDSVHLGSEKDLLGMLVNELKKENIKVGIYYSLMEFFPRKGRKYIEYIHNQIENLVKKYDPDLIWFDGDWVKTYKEWKMQDLLSKIYTLKPELIINSRLGKDFQTYQHFLTQNDKIFYDSKDRWIPSETPNFEWEHCTTLSKGWGYNRMHINSDWKTPEQLLNIYKEVISKKGHLLLNIGPTADGKILQEEINILTRFSELKI